MPPRETHVPRTLPLRGSVTAGRAARQAEMRAARATKTFRKLKPSVGRKGVGVFSF